MATVNDPRTPLIHPVIPGLPGQTDRERASEEYTHLQQDRLNHEEPTFGSTLLYIVISAVILGSVVGAAILYLMTH